LVDTGLAGSLVIEELDLLEETGLTMGIKTGSSSSVDSLDSECSGGNYERVSGYLVVCLLEERESLVREDCM